MKKAICMATAWVALAVAPAFPDQPAVSHASLSGVDFNRDIRPILANNCFKCHGPDEKERKADLRLDVEKAAVGKSGDDAPIIRGRPEESELIRRITTTEPSQLMPP